MLLLYILISYAQENETVKSIEDIAVREEVDVIIEDIAEETNQTEQQIAPVVVQAIESAIETKMAAQEAKDAAEDARREAEAAGREAALVQAQQTQLLVGPNPDIPNTQEPLSKAEQERLKQEAIAEAKKMAEQLKAASKKKTDDDEEAEAGR